MSGARSASLSRLTQLCVRLPGKPVSRCKTSLPRQSSCTAVNAFSNAPMPPMRPFDQIHSDGKKNVMSGSFGITPWLMGSRMSRGKVVSSIAREEGRLAP